MRYFSSSLPMTCMREDVIEKHWNVQSMMHLVELFVKLIELRRLRHDVLVHQEWRLDFFVSPLAQQVEPVRDESLIEVDTIIREEVSTMARDLGTCKILSGKISRRYKQMTRCAPRSRSIASSLSRTSWCAKIFVFFSTWPLGPSGCHVRSVTFSS